MSLIEAHKQLKWPTPEEILNPSGSGAKIYAELAKAKVGQTIGLLNDGKGINTGIITIDSTKDSTESPLAIVCEFPRPVTNETLIKTHRLAWNFSRSPLLITVEPNCIRAWSCCEKPENIDNPNNCIEKTEITEARVNFDKQISASEQAARALHWIEIVSGNFFTRFSSRFKRENCADHTLLENLRFVRGKLNEKGLNDDICHDLLARVIFIQFLFDRKDSNGKSALNEDRLINLYKKGILSEKYKNLAEILSNYKDTYSFFRLLNEKFNGDLFPGKGQTENDREAEWQNELKQVKESHLKILASFAKGNMKMENGQLTLWPMYSFDAIPLEFISSIYEEFVKNKKTPDKPDKKNTGIVYTPAHIVDFMLDGVLPWDNTNWDLKILDPACGSGIFLVKAYQRLIHRWKLAHPGTRPRAEDLRKILENNLFGSDIDEPAVRVASFSLYLSMCDEIDPIHYWDQVKFPQMRGRRLIQGDFFREDIMGLRTKEDCFSYDLIIGNPPWGKNIIKKSDYAESWANEHEWQIKYGDIGPLFLVKSAKLAREDAHISMIQPAGTLLFDQVGPARNFRIKFFETFKVVEIVNLSALRFGLFKQAISPACIVTMQPVQPDNEDIIYLSPKPLLNGIDEFQIIIEPHDINFIHPNEAAHDALIWVALIWGGKRDLQLVRWLTKQTNLSILEKKDMVKKREGIIFGDRKRIQKTILNKRILSSVNFIENKFLKIKAKDLPINEDSYVHSKDSTDFDAFELPQLIFKQGWESDIGRFSAFLVQSDSKTGGVLCTQSFVSISFKEGDSSFLETACLCYNSKLAVYYLLLSSGRFASYRPEIRVNDLMKIPVPEPQSNFINNIKTYDDVDCRIRELFGFKDSEWVLVEDLFDYTLADFKGGLKSPGRQKTNRQSQGEEEPDLKLYSEYFSNVLKAGFGQNKQICTTIFREDTGHHLPLRLVAIHLDWPGREDVRLETINSNDLYERLEKLNKKFLSLSENITGGIFYQRIARVYDIFKYNNKNISTVYIIKPDQKRYWTRSMAMRDADEVASDIMRARQTKAINKKGMGAFE